MPVLLQFFSFLPLLIVGRGQAGVKERLPRDVVGGCAAMGWGALKVALSWELDEIFHWSLRAAPEAVSSWSVFVGMGAFGLAFSLIIAGVGDVLVGAGMCFGRSVPHLFRQPFWAGGWMEFWHRWGRDNSSEEASFRSALIRCAAFLGGVGLWHGFHGGMAGWVLLQVSFLMIEIRLGRTRFGLVGWPHGLKGLLLTALFLLSLPCLYSPSIGAAVTQWQRLFIPREDNLYSLFLDARLTAPQVCWMLWAALALVLAPDVTRLGGQGSRLRAVMKVSGLVLGVLLGAMFVSSLPFMPDSWQALGGALRRAVHPEGNGQVCIGTDGWLYPLAELERFTEVRTTPSRVEAILNLQQQVQAQGAHLLLLPVPDKIMLRPEPLLPATYRAPVYPPGFHSALQSLTQGGVDVLDLTPRLWDERNRRPLHFHQDSHWRWEAMKEITVTLSRHVREKYPEAVNNETPLIDASFMERQDEGDLAQALQGKRAGSAWPLETAQMVGLRGLNTTETSPVLVIGGELIRVYDDPRLPFGPSAATDAPAGFPTQLGALLGQGVDVLDDSFGESPPSQVRGKKLVVWVIQAGEL